VLPADLGLPYHLVDLQGGLTLGLPAGGRLRVTAYMGDDVLDMTDYERPPGDSDDEGAILKVAWRWGNDLVGLRWDQPRGEWVPAASVGLSRFDERLGILEITGPNFESRVRQLFARGEVARDLAVGITLHLGAEANWLRASNTITGGGTTFWDR